MCIFNIQYDENTCFRNSTVSCSPNIKKRRTAKNVALELNDGTKINIKKLKISKKKDWIIKCEIKSLPAVDPLFIKERPITCDTGACFSVKMNPSLTQSVCQNRSLSSSTFEFNKKLFSYKGNIPPRSILFESEDGTQATFTCSQGTALYGSIPMDNKAVYIEQSKSHNKNNNEQIAVFLPANSPLEDNDVQDTLEDQPDIKSPRPNLELILRGTRDTTTLARYSIKFYYTPEFAAVTQDIPGFINQALGVVNLGYRNSKVPLEAYSVCTEQATIRDQESASALLWAFKNMKGTHSNLLGGADIAALLVNKMDADGWACGRGYINTVVNGGASVSVTKKSCILNYFSLGHEIGHNIGLHHDPATHTNTHYPYGHGHLIQRGVYPTGFRTIEAYDAAGHNKRINWYSNPAIIYHKTKTPTGVKGVSNNAYVLLRNRFILENIGNGECDGSPLTPATCCREVTLASRNREWQATRFLTANFGGGWTETGNTINGKSEYRSDNNNRYCLWFNSVRWKIHKCGYGGTRSYVFGDGPAGMKCPEQATGWRFWSQNGNGWINDRTMKVTCD